MTQQSYEHADVAESLLNMPGLALADHARWIVDRRAWAWRDPDTLLWISDAGGFRGARNHVRTCIAEGLRRIVLVSKGAPGVAKLGRMGFLDAVEQVFTGGISALSTWSEDWDASDSELQTPAGVFDLAEGQMRANGLADLNLNCTRAEPDSRVATPVFDELILAMMHGDTEMRDYLLLALSFCLIGEICESSFFLLMGGTGTGKSTLTGFMMRMLGSYATTTDPRVFAAVKEQFEEYQKAHLVGVRAAFVSEPSEGSVLNEGMLKRFTGGDEDTARPIREAPVRFRPKATIVMSANSLPRLQRGGSPMLRRMRVLVADAPPRVENRQLPAMLDAEAPGVMHKLCMRAHEYLRTRTAPVPVQVRDRVREHAASASAVEPWADECVALTGKAEDFIGTAELHRHFDAWRAGQEDRLGPVSVEAFAVRLQQWLNQKTYGDYGRTIQKKLAGKVVRGFTKIALKPATNQTDELNPF